MWAPKTSHRREAVPLVEAAAPEEEADRPEEAVTPAEEATAAPEGVAAAELEVDVLVGMEATADVADRLAEVEDVLLDDPVTEDDADVVEAAGEDPEADDEAAEDAPATVEAAAEE